MKIFIDTAMVDEIRKAKAMGLVDGVTTNPSLIAKTGRPFAEVIKEIVALVDGPISVEVVSLEAAGMVAEARERAAIHKNVVIKIPTTAEGLKAIRTLKEAGIQTNATLCFTPTQALLVAKAGATYVSPFVGRLDDISETGMDVVEQILEIYDNYDLDTQVIVASIRNPLHVLQSALMGAHAATIPFNVIQQLVHHPLTDSGIQRFLEDWKKVPK